MSRQDDARESSRARTERMRAQRAAEQARARRRARTVRFGALGLVLAVIAAVAISVVVTNRNSQQASAARPDGVPSSGNIGIPVGTATAPVLDVYEDFQCPVCQAYEKADGDQLSQLVQQGQVSVRYHLLTIIDGNVGNDASLRSGNAAACARDAGRFPQYHSTVYANPPAHEGDGFTNAQLLQFGRDAGITGAAYSTFSACVNESTYGGYIEAVGQAAQDRGVDSTPTFYLNGTKLDNSALYTDGVGWDPAKLTSVVASAGASSGSASPSTTTGTASPAPADSTTPAP